ncbi:hypothetical protein TIFTF001_026140 [Ficus carica]|uniref:Uncharacterized protein n=1 Tax=Ficus carica TaxID=3494 RepID=A0AA88DKQ4_FICCA|nr:hypothetical protein TIFTF001_026140 [Ficus carica]
MLKSTHSGRTGIGPPLDECHMPFQSDDRGHKYGLVLARVVSIVSVWLGSEGYHQGKCKDKYNNRKWMSGVRWCKVVGVACCATVLLSVSTGWCGRNSTRPTTQAEVQQWSGKCFPEPVLRAPIVICTGLWRMDNLRTNSEQVAFRRRRNYTINRSPLSTHGLIRQGFSWTRGHDYLGDRCVVLRCWSDLIKVVITRPGRCWSGDSEKDNLPGDVDIIGSLRSTDSSDSSDRTVASAEQAARTSDYLSDVSDIPTPRISRPDRAYARRHPTAKANSALVQPSRVVDLTKEEDAVAARMARQPSTSGFEETPDEVSESSRSATSPGEPIQFCQLGCSRILVYRMTDREMVYWAGGHPVYMVDYFTSAVTPEYLELLYGSLVDQVILLLRSPENVCCWLPRLGQELQALVVLCNGQMVVWSAKLHSGAIQEVGPPHIQNGLCVDKEAIHEVFKSGKDRKAPREGGP